MQIKLNTKDVFLKAQEEHKKLLLTYYSEKDNLFLTKLCVPILYVQEIIKNGPEFFYFWDDESDTGDKLFGLPSSEIKCLEPTEEIYEPKDYIIPDMWEF